MPTHYCFGQIVPYNRQFYARVRPFGRGTLSFAIALDRCSHTGAKLEVRLKFRIGSGASVGVNFFVRADPPGPKYGVPSSKIGSSGPWQGIRSSIATRSAHTLLVCQCLPGGSSAGVHLPTAALQEPLYLALRSADMRCSGKIAATSD